MIHGRINLISHEYKSFSNAKLLLDPDLEKLKKIYYDYCKYKKFISVMPFFEEEYRLSSRDIIGYYDNTELVAYTLLIKSPSSKSVVSDQFAWNYKNPRLRLGFKSIEHECYIYKSLGYEYLYVGEHAEYKSKFKGYELVGKNLQDTTSSYNSLLQFL